MRRSFSVEADTHLSIEIEVQQHIAGLQVQVEQGRREAVEEGDTQTNLVSQSEGQRPRWSST